MTPNAEHSLATGIFEVVPAIASWMNQILLATPNKFPTFTWEINKTTGEIVATLNEHGIVHEALVWYAYSCGTNVDGKLRRDFRIASIDKPQNPEEPKNCGCGLYDAKVISFISYLIVEGT